MKYILIALIISLIVLGGCDTKQSPKYFEIVSEKQGSFHEVILMSSGEFFEKKGTQNLGFDNQVHAGTINKETAQLLTNKAWELIKSPDNCNNTPSNEIIYFDGTSITKKCFDENAAFKDLFREVNAALTPIEPNNNFFIHLIENKGANVIDYHLHPNGLVIITNYGLSNTITSASIKSIPLESVNSLKTALTPIILEKDTNCTLFDSGYEYIEVQKGTEYNYYASCSKNPKEKQDFYENALKALGEAK